MSNAHAWQDSNLLPPVPKSTVDVYGHLAPGSNRNAVNKLDDDETPALRLASAAG